MNAHINIDLAIAADQVMKGSKLMDLKNNFDKQNQIISNITQDVQNTLNEIAYYLKFADYFHGYDNKLFDLIIKGSRMGAWTKARLLNLSGNKVYKSCFINLIDIITYFYIAKQITKTNTIRTEIWNQIKGQENSNLVYNIQQLAAITIPNN